MEQKVRIYIVEDYPLARITLKKSLEKFEDIEIIDSFESAEECIDALKTDQADVILMDIGLPYMSGIEATKKIKSCYSEVKVVMLTSHDNEEEVLSSFSSGANAFALKDISTDNLHTVITGVNKGTIWIDPKIAYIVHKTFAAMQPSTKNDFNLTQREKEVLSFLVKGYSNTEIAEKIFVSAHTVKAHVGNILTKLSVSDRVQAAVIATKYEL